MDYLKNGTVPDCNLRGKRIAILAHSATIAGEKALVAHQIRLYGLTTRIYWSLPKT